MSRGGPEMVRGGWGAGRRRTASIRTRRLLLTSSAALLLFGAVAALGEGPVAIQPVSGHFALGPGALPAGTVGGSLLNVSGDGSVAALTVWTSPGVGSYFLGVVDFTIEAHRAVQVDVGVSLDALTATWSPGEELLALLGTPSTVGDPGGHLSQSAALAGSPLRGIQGLGGAENGFPGLLAGFAATSLGQTSLGNASSVTLTMASSETYVLVLSIGVLLPVGAPTPMGDPVLSLTVSLSHSL